MTQTVTLDTDPLVDVNEKSSLVLVHCQAGANPDSIACLIAMIRGVRKCHVVKGDYVQIICEVTASNTFELDQVIESIYKVYGVRHFRKLGISKTYIQGE